MNIVYKNYNINVVCTLVNTSIYDSYKIHSISDMKNILNIIKKSYDETFAINKISMFNMINEWRTHNLLYSLGIFKNRTKTVDINSDKPKYTYVLYAICSFFYFHFFNLK